MRKIFSILDGKIAGEMWGGIDEIHATGEMWGGADPQDPEDPEELEWGDWSSCNKECKRTRTRTDGEEEEERCKIGVDECQGKAWHV